MSHVNAEPCIMYWSNVLSQKGTRTSPKVPEMTYSVSIGTLNFTQPSTESSHLSYASVHWLIKPLTAMHQYSWYIAIYGPILQVCMCITALPQTSTPDNEELVGRERDNGIHTAWA